jgi:hypothetical protein
MKNPLLSPTRGVVAPGDIDYSKPTADSEWAALLESERRKKLTPAQLYHEMLRQGEFKGIKTTIPLPLAQMIAEPGEPDFKFGDLAMRDKFDWAWGLRKQAVRKRKLGGLSGNLRPGRMTNMDRVSFPEAQPYLDPDHPGRGPTIAIRTMYEAMEVFELAMRFIVRGRRRADAADDEHTRKMQQQKYKTTENWLQARDELHGGSFNSNMGYVFQKESDTEIAQAIDRFAELRLKTRQRLDDEYRDFDFTMGVGTAEVVIPIKLVGYAACRASDPLNSTGEGVWDRITRRAESLRTGPRVRMSPTELRTMLALCLELEEQCWREQDQETFLEWKRLRKQVEARLEMLPVADTGPTE